MRREPALPLLETRQRAHAGEKTEGESESCVGLLGRFGGEWPSGGPWRSFVVDVSVVHYESY
jgi:hypothetical protein